MGLKLVLDAGNTCTKIALYDGDDLIESVSVNSNVADSVNKLIEEKGIPQSCIISSVTGSQDKIISELKSSGITKIIVIRGGLRLPVRLAYKTPETLGSDRLANACGAWKMHPHKNVLVVDMGTCIKFDLITADETYRGGSISPGLNMRYKALNSFTGQLPYFQSENKFPSLTGNSTETAIRSGVENGIVAELDGIIMRYIDEFNQLEVLFTGGDQARFADKVKSPIFVAPNLTLNGLKVILDHNDL